jgi:hypothetical protein
LGTDLDTIKQECNQLWEEVQAEQHWLHGQGLHLGQELRECQTQIKADVQAVSSSLQELHEEARGAMETINFQHSFSDDFHVLRTGIEQCEQASALLLGRHEVTPDVSHADLDQLQDSYTMESERVTHAAALGKSSRPAVARGPVVTRARPRPSPMAPVIDARLETEPASAPAAVATTPAPGRTTTGLGDNVDLF